MGEYLVGAYLKMVVGCDVVDYGVRLPGGKLRGLHEIDVIGFKFSDRSVWMCEAVTHLTGALYGDYDRTVKKLGEKIKFHHDYADGRLQHFPARSSMLWAPWVSSGLRTRLDLELPEVELVVNQEYAKRIDVLLDLAREGAHDTGNPAFRVLQILGHIHR